MALMLELLLDQHLVLFHGLVVLVEGAKLKLRVTPRNAACNTKAIRVRN